MVDNVVDYGYRRVADDTAKCRLVVGGADGSRVDHFVTAELRLSADAAYRRASADCGNVAAILGKNVVVEQFASQIATGFADAGAADDAAHAYGSLDFTFVE